MTEIDAEQLSLFIQKQHLEMEAIEKYADDYQSHRANVLQIENFFDQSLAKQCNQYLSNDAKYGEIHGLYSVKGHVISEDLWHDAEEKDRFFYFEMADGTREGARFNREITQFLKFRKFLNSSEFKKYIERLVGRPLGDIVAPKIHRMNHQHFLKRHDDRTSKRTLAFVLYLTPGWLPSDGGALVMEGASSELFSFESYYNSLIIFDVNSHHKHYVSEINQCNDSTREHFRFCVTGWFKAVE